MQAAQDLTSVLVVAQQRPAQIASLVDEDRGAATSSSTRLGTTSTSMAGTYMVRLMPPSVSVPEKTLEHWSSQYVTYRYRSKAALWWPTTGEDIDIRWLPTRPGKAVQLELKTTTVSGVGLGLHDVMVDLGQLWEYRHRSLGRQPFYAFPWPDWGGLLTDAAMAGSRPVTELAFSRSGLGWWFADWMVVLTAAQVEEVLRKELKTHGSRDRGKKKRLVRIDVTHSPTRPIVTWGSGATPPQLVRWRDFWTALEQCGRVGWPQLIRLPARMVRAQGRYSPSQVADLLRAATDMVATGEWEHDGQLVTLEPETDGTYHVAPGPDGDLGGHPNDGTHAVDEHRQVVFLEAGALLRKVGSG